MRQIADKESTNIKTAGDFDAEITEINEEIRKRFGAIDAIEDEIRNLKAKRDIMVKKFKKLDVVAALEDIIESGVPLDVIKKALAREAAKIETRTQ